jgi:hypothetical protein
MWTATGLLLAFALTTRSTRASPIASDRWFQEPDSAAAKLFARGPSDSYPDGYSTPPTSSTPQAWTDRLAQVVASDSFPNYGPRASETAPWYASDGTVLQSNDPSVCLFTSGCENPLDIMYAGEGNIGVSPVRIARYRLRETKFWR